MSKQVLNHIDLRIRKHLLQQSLLIKDRARFKLLENSCNQFIPGIEQLLLYSIFYLFLPNTTDMDIFKLIDDLILITKRPDDTNDIHYSIFHRYNRALLDISLHHDYPVHYTFPNENYYIQHCCFPQDDGLAYLDLANYKSMKNYDLDNEQHTISVPDIFRPNMLLSFDFDFIFYRSCLNSLQSRMGILHQLNLYLPLTSFFESNILPSRVPNIDKRRFLKLQRLFRYKQEDINTMLNSQRKKFGKKNTKNYEEMCKNSVIVILYKFILQSTLYPYDCFYRWLKYTIHRIHVDVSPDIIIYPNLNYHLLTISYLDGKLHELKSTLDNIIVLMDDPRIYQPGINVFSHGPYFNLTIIQQEINAYLFKRI
jgi:hypothetical protein